MTQRAIDGNYIYFVTANVHHGRWFFDTSERAERLGQAIQTCCRIKLFDLLAYCILPNHFHLLIRKLGANEMQSLSSAFWPHCTRGRVQCGEGETTLTHEAGEASNIFLFPHRRRPRLRPLQERFTLSQLMHSIKSVFAHSLSQGKFWHHRSYFRIIESEEYLGNVIEYIRYNYRKVKPRQLELATSRYFRAGRNPRTGDRAHQPSSMTRVGGLLVRGMNLPEQYGQPSFVFIDQSAIRRIFNDQGHY